jgi:hypothetical protein
MFIYVSKQILGFKNQILSRFASENEPKAHHHRQSTAHKRRIMNQPSTIVCAKDSHVYNHSIKPLG